MRALLLLPAALAAAAGSDPYCNEAMDTGVIPPLPTGTDLAQVHVLIRHGSRSRCSVGFSCWAGDLDATYDCSSAVLEGAEAPPPGSPLPAGSVLYRKNYLPGRNLLRGDCALGQLVAAGAEMQRASGKRLRAAYGAFLPRSPAGANQSFFLLRSDDEPRTLASGQALFGAMYPEARPPQLVMPWYTEDRAGESTIVCTSSKVCPALLPALSSVHAAEKSSAHYAHVTVPLAAELSSALNYR